MSLDHHRLVVDHIIRGQHVEAKSILLKYKWLFKYADKSGQTLLHVSAKYGNEEITRFLIQCGCPVNFQDKFGITPLMLAVTDANDDATVKVLLNANADIHLTDIRRSSSLRKVIQISQTWFEMLTAGSIKDTKHYQILKMFFSKVEQQFAHNRELMAKTLREAHCPLALVIFMRNVSLTKYLLNSGYPIDEHLRNWSTLHIAVLLNDFDNVAFLVEFGANVNDQDNLNQTPLFLYDRSVDNNHEQLEILKVLLNNGASLLISRSDGVTLMEYFFTSSKKNTLMALVQSNTDELMKCTVDGKTPLHFLVKNHNAGTDTVIELLLRKNIDIDAADNEGRTALVNAVNAGLISKINVLIKLGAKVNFIDILDKTNLFDVLIDPDGYSAEYTEIVNILLHPRENSTSDNESSPFVIFQFRRNRRYRLAKMILKHLALDEASCDNVSVHAFAKLESSIELKEYYEACKLQLQKMKTITIYASVTIYKILTESEEKIMFYARNDVFLEVFKEFMKNKTHRNFYYLDYLQKRVDNAVELAFLRREGSRVICKLTKLYPDPNCYIYYEIVKYMSKQDLYNLIEV